MRLTHVQNLLDYIDWLPGVPFRFTKDLMHGIKEFDTPVLNRIIAGNQDVVFEWNLNIPHVICFGQETISIADWQPIAEIIRRQALKQAMAEEQKLESQRFLQLANGRVANAMTFGSQMRLNSKLL